MIAHHVCRNDAEILINRIIEFAFKAFEGVALVVDELDAVGAPDFIGGLRRSGVLAAIDNWTYPLFLSEGATE